MKDKLEELGGLKAAKDLATLQQAYTVRQMLLALIARIEALQEEREQFEERM